MGSQRALPKITEVFPYWQDINSTDRLQRHDKSNTMRCREAKFSA